MKITTIGAHNTESLTTRYPCLLVDDVIALDAGSLTSGISFENQLKIKAILLTHSHYDHIRDIPAFAMNLFLRDSHIHIFTLEAVKEKLLKYLLDGELYPDFHNKPEENPVIRFHIVQAFQQLRIEEYDILPVPVNHSIPSMGYQITSPDGAVIFYTGDTGRDLTTVWEHISPQILFIEVTASNYWAESAKKSGHLTPSLLNRELISFRELKGYLPRVVAVHVNPENENDIEMELSQVAESLGADIQIAHEGMEIKLT